MQQINLEEVTARMEEFRANERPKTERPGIDGVLARCQLAITPEMTIWRCNEINRGTSPNDLMNAVVMLVASTVSGEVMASTDTQEQALMVTNRVLSAIAEEIATIILGVSNVTMRRFDMKDAGHA